jgi:hypothetical protein
MDPARTDLILGHLLVGGVFSLTAGLILHTTCTVRSALVGNKWMTQRLRYGWTTVALMLFMVAVFVPIIRFGIHDTFTVLGDIWGIGFPIGWAIGIGWGFGLAFPVIVPLAYLRVYRWHSKLAKRRRGEYYSTQELRKQRASL